MTDSNLIANYVTGNRPQSVLQNKTGNVNAGIVSTSYGCDVKDPEREVSVFQPFWLSFTKKKLSSALFPENYSLKITFINTTPTFHGLIPFTSH